MVDSVVKVGGGLLAEADRLDAVLAAIASAAKSRRIVVVPGGGPFADTVRAVDRRLGLADTTAHWMAVLAMDQYAHLIAAQLRDAVLVHGPRGIEQALDVHQLPVLAPFRWMHDVDPLPHSWDVTSDSIAAWVAGQTGARQLVLVKPVGAPIDPVDPYFPRALPAEIRTVLVPADRIEMLAEAVSAST